MRFDRALVSALLLTSLVACSDAAQEADDDEQDEQETETNATERNDAGTTRLDAGAQTERGLDAAPAKDAARAVTADAVEPAHDAGATDASSVSVDASDPSDRDASATFALSSSIYKDGEAIPSAYRCASPSPALSWTAGPAGTLSYALALRDVTPGASQGVTHWLIYDIPATRLELPMGVPEGAPAALAPIKQGPNYQRARVYQGPCASSGNNTYELTLYAIDVEALPQLSASASSAQVLAAIEAHDLARSTLRVTSSPN